jgi:hypothetical protein
MTYAHLQRCTYTPGCYRCQYTTVKTADGFATICRQCFQKYKQSQEDQTDNPRIDWVRL